jgi:protein-tyrosine phosphatase
MKRTDLPFARSCTFFVVPLTLVAMLSGCGTTDTKPGAATATAAVAKPGQSLGIESLPNLRDLGGYKTSDGATVAGKLVYRSSQLTDISEGDMKKLDNLNLKTDLDLRTAQERNPNPDQLPPGVNSIWLNVLADADQAGLAQLNSLMNDPKAANAALGGGKAEAVLKAMYRQFITLPSANKSYSQLFLTLADQKQLPALFHCTGGKDRTGWAAAAFLTLLGVPKETVMQDYLRTNDYVLPAVQKANAAFVQAGGDPSIPSAIQGAKKEYLQAAFDEMTTKYGTIEQYFSKGLGIDASQQKALRDLYLGQR